MQARDLRDRRLLRHVLVLNLVYVCSTHDLSVGKRLSVTRWPGQCGILDAQCMILTLPVCFLMLVPYKDWALQGCSCARWGYYLSSNSIAFRRHG